MDSPVGQPLSKFVESNQSEFVRVEDRDHPFDPFLRLPADKAAQVAAELECVLRGQRQRARTAAQEALHPERVGLIIANALRAREQGKACFYSRAHGAYATTSLYNPEHAGDAPTLAIIDTLEASGLLEGVRQRPGSNVRRRSTFRCSDELATRLLRMGVTARDVQVDHERRPVVWLKDASKRPVGYDLNSSAIVTMDVSLRRYNAFMSDVPVTHVSGVQKAYWEPLYRVFNNSSFEQGGRFYGSAHQLMRGRLKPGDAPDTPLRSGLLIAGASTVEIDFRAFQPTLLHHWGGRQPQEDPYLIPELERAARGRLTDREVRSAAKLATVIMINRTHDRGIRGHRSRMGLCRGLSCTRVFDITFNHQETINQHYYQGIGMRLMNTESIITQIVMDQAVRLQIPCLPVHDSMIVREDNYDVMVALMIDTYSKVVGVRTVVSL